MKNFFLGFLCISALCVAAPSQSVLVSHVRIFGSAPAIGSCGTGAPSVIGNDSNGLITTGTGTPTTCAITFASTWTSVPHCFVSDETAVIALEVTPTATGLTITAAAGITNGTKLDYFCTNHQ